jgi:hypothetical protein
MRPALLCIAGTCEPVWNTTSGVVARLPTSILRFPIKCFNLPLFHSVWTLRIQHLYGRGRNDSHRSSPILWKMNKNLIFIELRLPISWRIVPFETVGVSIRTRVPRPLHTINVHWGSALQQVLRNAARLCKPSRLHPPSTLVCVWSKTLLSEKILDDLRKSIEREMEYQEDRMGFIKRSFAKGLLGRQSEVADEIIHRIFRSDLIRKPHTITSATMEQVMKLPETNTTMLIISETEDSVAPPALRPLKMIRGFRALVVNIERFHSGKRTKVFDQVQCLMCDPKVSSQKNLLSMFVLTCLEPFVFIPGTPQTTPPSRPRRVLLEKGSDADDPQVQMFLSMMGAAVETLRRLILVSFSCSARPAKKSSCKAQNTFVPRKTNLTCGTWRITSSVVTVK